MGDPSRPASGGAARATLDELLRRSALRRPDQPALIDPPNRSAFTDGAPRRLTYAEADRIVSAVAASLQQLGLQADTVVAVQLPNIAESALAVLGILRAGMIAAPMPLLWRRAEAVAALGRVGAKVLIAGGRVGDVDHCELAMHVAAELFPIRYVCAFGASVPDGMVPLDLDALSTLEPRRVERQGNPAAHTAIITWDVTADGLLPVARNHSQLVFGGLPVLLESRLRQDAAILTTAGTSSFAGLAAALVPWLLIGGTLALHHPFDPEVLARQCRDDRCGAVVLPGPLAVRLADAGLFSGLQEPRALVGLWRSPERLAGSAPCRGNDVALTDVQVFGEIGLVAARRGPSGRPSPIGFGPISAPRGGPGAALVGEIAQTGAGTLAFRGPMVAAEPLGGHPHFRLANGDFIDTGYPCRPDPETQGMVVTGPPPEVVTVGSYRFAWRELQSAIARTVGEVDLAVMSDPLSGQRLTVSTSDPAAARRTMTDGGLNPLVVAALRAHAGAPKASAA